MSKKDKRNPSHDRVNKNHLKNRPMHLVDFLEKWPDTHRPAAITLLQRDSINSDEKFVLEWLVKLADRVGKEDID